MDLLIQTINDFFSISGRPKPNVTWYLDNKMIDYTVESVNTDLNGQITTINELLLPNVGRREQNSTLLCQASNTNLTPPTSKSIMLDINRKYRARQQFLQFPDYHTRRNVYCRLHDINKIIRNTRNTLLC